ncbi:MAG: PhnD/SsuA/transferrin family substrate-binding protein [Acidimicrobiia bacterium]|nr:PhnD/SsuA/transferrin family substrate-binding protein [Acidimicrobiia bacterium]
MRIRSLIGLLLALMLVMAACSSDDADDTTTTTAAETTTTAAETTTTAAETTTTEAAAPDVGTAENPIQVLFVPSVSAEEIIAGGELLRVALEEATGLTFEVSVPTSYAATINEICASPANTIGFIPAQAYVLGNELCGIEVALKSLRFGYTEYWAQFITQRDNDEISTLEDIAGKTWAYPDATSTSGFLVPSGLLSTLGIAPGESFEAGGHSAVARAIYNGEAEVGTTFFSPAVTAERDVLWDGTAAGADVPDDLVADCGLDAEGEILCGEDYFPRDARRNIREEAPDVIQKVKIFALSDPIPNDTMSYGSEFPAELATSITQAMKAYAVNDPDGFEAAFDAYSWSGVDDTNDAEFDFIRQLVQQLGITVDDL